MVPWLLFAKRHLPRGSNFLIPQTELAKAEDVARVLARHQVENVVLNACLSAYNQSGPATNLAHIFLRHGILNVSAMWFLVHWKTVSAYVEAFYDKLLVECLDFHTAAQQAREALRLQPSAVPGRTYMDFFLCVNYARNVHGSDRTRREVSPSPSAISHDSALSASNESTSSFRSSRLLRTSPRPGASPAVGDDPVIRLQLHLLDLEYKLTTFKIVYASDVGQVHSKLDATMDGMVNMWLKTNLVDEVHYYKAKDFEKCKVGPGGVSVSPREKRTRAMAAGPMQRLFSQSVESLRQTLHVIREVDAAVDPGSSGNEFENQRREERGLSVQRGLRLFARRLHRDDDGYIILLGRQNKRWCEKMLKDLNGECWIDVPWSFTEHAKYNRNAGAAANSSRRPQIGSGIL